MAGTKGRTWTPKRWVKWPDPPTSDLFGWGREALARQVAGGVEKHPAARRVVARALVLGIVTRPDACDRCKAPAAVEAHHSDYDNPLAVEWLCEPCHSETHRERNPKGNRPTRGGIAEWVRWRCERNLGLTLAAQMLRFGPGYLSQVETQIKGVSTTLAARIHVATGGTVTALSLLYPNGVEAAVGDWTPRAIVTGAIPASAG